MGVGYHQRHPSAPPPDPQKHVNGVGPVCTLETGNWPTLRTRSRLCPPDSFCSGGGRVRPYMCPACALANVNSDLPPGNWHFKKGVSLRTGKRR